MYKEALKLADMAKKTIKTIRDKQNGECDVPTNLTDILSSCCHLIRKTTKNEPNTCTICKCPYSSLLMIMDGTEGESDLNEDLIQSFLSTVMIGRRSDFCSQEV